MYHFETTCLLYTLSTARSAVRKNITKIMIDDDIIIKFWRFIIIYTTDIHWFKTINSILIVFRLTPQHLFVFKYILEGISVFFLKCREELN